MNATIYTLTAQEVQLVNSFTHLRNAAGPAHFIGDGYALAGVQQQPAGHVFALGGGRYIVMRPELHDALVDAARRELLAQLSAAPWWLRVWRALGLRPAWPVWRWPAF